MIAKLWLFTIDATAWAFGMGSRPWQWAVNHAMAHAYRGYDMGDTDGEGVPF